MFCLAHLLLFGISGIFWGTWCFASRTWCNGLPFSKSLAYLVYFGVDGILVGVIGVFEIGISCLLHLQFELVHLMFPSLMMRIYVYIL